MSFFAIVFVFGRVALFTQFLKFFELLLQFLSTFELGVFQNAKIQIQSRDPIFTFKIVLRPKHLFVQVFRSEDKLEMAPELLILFKGNLIYIHIHVHWSYWLSTEAK